MLAQTLALHHHSRSFCFCSTFRSPDKHFNHVAAPAMSMLFPCRQGPRPPRVLLPGAGLGRLCVEVAAAGFEAQGNEFSYFMLLTAAFMLNSTACAEQWTIHPWVHLTCNNVTDADQLRGVSVPDVVPSSLVEPGMLSMCAGDFAVSGAPHSFITLSASFELKKD